MQTPTPEETIRLNRYLAQCGLGARRKCDEIIAAGHVFLNGRKVTEMGAKVGPGDRVECRGRVIRPMHRLEYCAYHKPAGIMVTKDDPEKRITVYEAMRRAGRDINHLNYIGRLDYASEGLLLLTNDGSLIHALTHPRYRIKKVYRVRLDKPMSAQDIAAMRAGIEDGGQLLSAGDVRPMLPKGPAPRPPPTRNAPHKGKIARPQIRKPDLTKPVLWYEIDLYEGKNRQLRRMLSALSYDVVRLQRIQFASVKIGDLPPGAIRPLTVKEVAACKAAGYPSKKGG